MTDTPATTAPADAAEVLGTAPDLPTGTPTAAAPAAQPGADPVPAAPPPSTPDKSGAVWDARYHENPPRINAEGRWAKLRGNAARKAAGLPPSGATASRAFRPAAPPEAAPAAPPPPPPVSTPPPVEMLGGPAAPPIRDGVPVPPGEPAAPLRPFEDYAPTAAGAVDGAAGIAQLTLGAAWQLTPTERTSLVGAVQRVLHHYQLPVVGPLLELVLVGIPIITKRRNDPQTRQTISGWLDRLRGRHVPPAKDPYRDLPAAGSSAPAPAAPPPPDEPAPAAPRQPLWLP